MSVANTRPGVWITYRCHRCLQLRATKSAEHFLTLDAAWEDAVARGWTTAPLNGVEDGAIICPPCSKEGRS